MVHGCEWDGKANVGWDGRAFLLRVKLIDRGSTDTRLT